MYHWVGYNENVSDSSGYREEHGVSKWVLSGCFKYVGEDEVYRFIRWKRFVGWSWGRHQSQKVQSYLEGIQKVAGYWIRVSVL